MLINIILTSKTYAQGNDLKFKRFSIDDGLSHNKINSISQDSRGFMWFGTNEGLNKYDGYEFTKFEKGINNINKLSDDYIQCIFEDSKENIWIGTINGGLNSYDRIYNRFVQFYYDSSQIMKFKKRNIISILEDKTGKIWIGAEYIISMIDLLNNKNIDYIPSHLKDSNSNKSDITVLFEDNQNNLWFGTSDDGLGLFDRKNNTFKYYHHDINNNKSISDNDIRSIYEDIEGNLWIGTYRGGFNLLDREKELFDRFYPDPKVQESLTVRAINEDNKGNLWIGTRNGLYLFNKKTHRYYNCIHDPHNYYSLSQNNIQVIFKDDKGDFWVATKGGLNLLNSTNMPFAHYRADIYNKRYLNHNVISTIYEDSMGDIWFGSSEKGLNRLNRKTGIYTYYTYNVNDPNSLGSNNVNTIIEGENGNLWIGTFQGGLNHFDRQRNQFIVYKLKPDAPLTHQNAIHSLCLDKSGNIWIGTNGMGLNIFNIKKQLFTRLTLNEKEQNFVIYIIIQDTEGKIWLGCNNSKIYCIDNKNMKSQFYRLPTHSDKTHINILLEDKKHNLWIGTNGSGLFYFDKNRKTFHTYTKENGLSSNHIHGILIDEQENLWISTSYGLSKFNTAANHFKNYYKENGLQSNQFTKACYKTRSGEMFFGGINGATAFFPNQIIENSFIPPVVITDFKIFNKSVRIGGKNPILKKSISETEEILLSHKHSSFSFTFSALDYSITEQNQYAYMMEGFEKDWNYIGTRNFATYTNLDPGIYTFKVKAANNDGLWNEKGVSIKISISPPFWKTWWFSIIIGVIVLFGILHLINYQTQKRNLLKTTALANMAQLKLFRNQMNPHFLFNTLSSIRALILIDKDQAWQMLSKLSEFYRYVLLNYNKIENSLNEEIDAVNNFISIQKVCFYDSLNISSKVDDDARKCIVPAFILQPLTENAIKHGIINNPEQLIIKLEIRYKQKILSIDIANKGKLESKNKKESHEDKAHGTSIINIKKRLELMFRDRYQFQLYEEEGWVHAKIIINYSNKKLFKKKKYHKII
jgi:ligand-binding sensor domain-containing protein